MDSDKCTSVPYDPSPLPACDHLRIKLLFPLFFHLALCSHLTVTIAPTGNTAPGLASLHPNISYTRRLRLSVT
eukprot:940913-Amphidinium_carterae.1